MSTGDPNYIIIRRAIFGKVHGDGVKEIWLISQFPAKHTGVASGAKIVFARPGLTLFSGYGHAVINNEVIIFIVCSPQSDCISLFWDPSVTFFTLSNGEVSQQEESWKTPTLKPLRSKHFWLSEKKRSLKYQNKMAFQISLVTRKYRANCRIHARMRKKIENNFLFKFGGNV